MRYKVYYYFVLGVLGEGGASSVGTKSQLFPQIPFDGFRKLSPNTFPYCIKSVVSEILQYDDKGPPFPILWQAFAKLYTVIDCLSFAQHWLQHQQPHQQLLASKSEKVSFLIKNFFSPQTHRVVESMERNRLMKMVASNATNLPYFMSAGSSASITQSDLRMSLNISIFYRDM